ncbi:GIY-YIG nuclease family protein [Persicimonas caeni]|uniref:GIY-YIG nuclease family protein n=1 Tax=Persicimonas caeni TaxID=2292766 RepID=UPI001C9A91DB|nr:GIY-YIG nuclease family protein [Persicimonas caeni]
MSSEWYLYVLECVDETLYTGITTDLERRLHEHNHTAKGAKYTRCRRPVELVASWTYESRSDAASAEWHFKQLTRRQKLRRVEERAAAE